MYTHVTLINKTINQKYKIAVHSIIELKVLIDLIFEILLTIELSTLAVFKFEPHKVFNCGTH